MLKLIKSGDFNRSLKACFHFGNFLPHRSNRDPMTVNKATFLLFTPFVLLGKAPRDEQIFPSE